MQTTIADLRLSTPATMAARRQGSVVVDEADVHVTSVLAKRHEHAVLEDNATLDDATLGALGYKQEFKR